VVFTNKRDKLGEPEGEKMRMVKRDDEVIVQVKNEECMLVKNTNTGEGEGPGSLFPPMEHNYNLKGNSGSKTPATVVPFKDTQNSPVCTDDCD